MNGTSSFEEYLLIMAGIIGKIGGRAPPELKDRLDEESAILRSLSPEPAAEPDYRRLYTRHSATVGLLHAVIESMPISEGKEVFAEIHTDLGHASRLIENLATPRIVQKRMGRAVIGGTGDHCRPIFLISSWRSGSTLLLSLLDSHKNLVALPETMLLDPFILTAADMAKKMRPILLRRRPPILEACNHAVHFGITDEQFFEYFSVFIESIVSSYVREKGGRRWVYKEATNPGSVALIDALFGYRAYFVWLVRHGLDVVNSEIERYERHCLQYPDVAEYAREWASRNELYADFCERTPDRCTKLRYEDFVANPISEARRLFAFLGEPWDDEVFSSMQHSTNVLGGDHKFIRNQGLIDPGRMEHWKQWPQIYIQQLGRIVNPTLVRTGYDPVS